MPFGELVRIHVGGGVVDLGGIENQDVGERAGRICPRSLSPKTFAGRLVIDRIANGKSTTLRS